MHSLTRMLRDHTTPFLHLQDSLRTKLGEIKKALVEQEKALADQLGKVAVAFANEVAPAKPKFVVASVDCGGNPKAMNQGIQELKKKSPATAVMLFSPVDDAVTCMAVVPKDVNKKTKFSALEWLETVIPLIGGACRHAIASSASLVFLF